MTTATATRRLTREEFVALPERKPYHEYLRGEVTERTMPTDLHGMSVMRLGTRFVTHLDSTGEGICLSEVRHEDVAQDWVYLPDVEIQLGADELQERGTIKRPPDLAVEVLSPDDRVMEWLERVELYMRAGTKLLWVVDPYEETIRAFRPGQDARVARAGDTLDALPVLADFSLDVGAFFASLRRKKP